MKYQLFYLSAGNFYPLSSLDEDGTTYNFDTPEEAYSCFQGWVTLGYVHWPKITIVVLPVVQQAEA